jgi:chromosome partitioning protein
VIDCASPSLLAAKVAALQKAGAKLVLIDTPPSADATAVAAAKTSDLILIPLRVRAFDLAAARATADLVRTWRKPAFAVWMAGPVRAPRLYEEGADVAGVPVAPVMLPERADFQRGTGEGKAAQDVAPEGAAAREVAALFDWLQKELGGSDVALC